MASIEERHADAEYVVVASPPAPQAPERSADEIARRINEGGAR